MPPWPRIADCRTATGVELPKRWRHAAASSMRGAPLSPVAWHFEQASL
jgi:hypothetical protein